MLDEEAEAQTREEEASVQPAPEEEKTERVRTVNGIERMTPEEAQEYRTQRLEELDKYAAELAAADDESTYSDNDPDDDDTYYSKPKKKHNVGRVILWILAAILVLVCVGAILYMMFGSFLKPSDIASPSASIKETVRLAIQSILNKIS